jgi:hypothetical protein
MIIKMLKVLKMNKTEFKLKSFKITKGDGLIAEWIRSEKSGMETFDNKETRESPKFVHNDLKKKVESLGEIVATIRGYNDFKLVTESREFAANDKQKEAIDKTILEIKKRISVSGISLSGQGEKKKVVITFKFTEDNGQVKGGSTHPIFLSETKFGYEEDLEKIVNDLEDEVFSYLFEDKKADLSLFSNKMEQPEKQLKSA